MKILIIQDGYPPFGIGGAATVAALQAEELARRGHHVVVATSVEKREDAGDMMQNGVDVRRVFLPSLRARRRSWVSLYRPRAIGEVHKLLEEIKPDIVHCHNVHESFSYGVLTLAKHSGAKVFLTAHDAMLFHYGKLAEFISPQDISCKSSWNYSVTPWQQVRRYKSWYNPFRNYYIRRAIRNVGRVIAVSESLQEALNQNGIQNTTLLHNGIELSQWAVQPGEAEGFLTKHDLHGRKVILFAGRITASKGGDAVLSALPSIVKEIPGAALLIAGRRDTYVQTLLMRASKLNLEKYICCLGWLSPKEMKAAYGASDVVAAPSVYLDPFPTVVLEAMAAGKAVVGSCLGGMPEMISEGETGFLVHPLDQNNLAGRIVDLLKDTGRARRFGYAARTRAEKFFSIEENVEKLLSLYEA